jgi:hypothetical protein
MVYGVFPLTMLMYAWGRIGKVYGGYDGDAGGDIR